MVRLPLARSPKRKEGAASPPQASTSATTATSPEYRIDKDGNRIGNWTSEEDELLRTLVAEHGEKKWSLLQKSMKTRSGKQMRERWFGHLDNTRKIGPWTDEENARLEECQVQFPNKWARMAKLFPGRTDNDIKNHWNLSQNKVSRGTQHGSSSSLAPAHDIMATTPRSAALSSSSSAQSLAHPPSPMVKSSSSHSISSVASSLPASKSSTSLASIASPRYTPYPRSNSMVKSRSEQVPSSPHVLVASTSAIPLGQHAGDGPYATNGFPTSPAMARSQSYSVPGAYSPRTPRSFGDEPLHPSPAYPSRDLNAQFEILDPSRAPSGRVTMPHVTPNRPTMHRQAMSTPLLPSSSISTSHFSPLTPLSTSRGQILESPSQNWAYPLPFSPSLGHDDPIPPFAGLNLTDNLNEPWMDSVYPAGHGGGCGPGSIPLAYSNLPMSSQLSYETMVPYSIAISSVRPSTLELYATDPLEVPSPDFASSAQPFGYDDGFSEWLNFPPNGDSPTRTASPFRQKWMPSSSLGVSSSGSSSSVSSSPLPSTEEEVVMLDEALNLTPSILPNSTSVPLTPRSPSRIVVPAPKVRSSSRTIRPTPHAVGASEMNYTPSPTTRLSSSSSNPNFAAPSPPTSNSSSPIPRQYSSISSSSSSSSSSYNGVPPRSSSTTSSPSMTRSTFNSDLHTSSYGALSSPHSSSNYVTTNGSSRGRGGGFSYGSTNGHAFGLPPPHMSGNTHGLVRGGAVFSVAPGEVIPFSHPTGDLMEIDSYGKARFPGAVGGGGIYPLTTSYF